MMKDIYFNELSVPFPIVNQEEAERLVYHYAATIKEAHSQGFNKVRYEKGVEYIMLRKDYSLAQYINENSTDQSVRVLLATQTKPYIAEGDEMEEKYVLNDYHVKWKNSEVEAEGLITAAIASSMGIGWVNEEWNDDSYEVIEKSGEKHEILHSMMVPYAYNTKFFFDDKFQQWADENLVPEIEDCKILPMEKDINLPQHHGVDVLKKYAKRLVRESYVKGILNSIDRDSKQRNFISGMDGNIVYITLINDGHFGLAISTTARNNRELRYIAKLIEQKYK